MYDFKTERRTRFRTALRGIGSTPKFSGRTDPFLAVECLSFDNRSRGWVCHLVSSTVKTTPWQATKCTICGNVVVTSPQPCDSDTRIGVSRTSFRREAANDIRMEMCGGHEPTRQGLRKQQPTPQQRRMLRHATSTHDCALQ